MSYSNRSPFRLDTDLLSLRSLIAIADTGSFSAAANHIGRTQSAVSLQIAKLEDRLQTKLLDRTSRHVTVTASGETLIAYARRLVTLADEAATALSAPDITTPFRIGFAEYLAPAHLHVLLGRFRHAHPKLLFELKIGTGYALKEALDEGRLDIVIAGPDGGAIGPGEGHVLQHERMVWVASPEDPCDASQPLPLIVMEAPCSYRLMAITALKNAERPWHIVTEANSLQAVQSAIKARLGVSIMAESAVCPGLHILEKGLPDLPDTAMVAYQAKVIHPLNERFLAFLQEGLLNPIDKNAEMSHSFSLQRSKP